MTKPNEPNILITRLVDDLHPIAAPPKPALGAAIWVVASLLSGIALVSLFHWRSDAAEIAGAPAHLAFSALLFFGICALGFTVFRSGIPGRDSVPGSKWIATGVVFGLVLLLGAYVLGEPAGSVADGLDPHGVHCSLTTAVLSILPATFLLLILKLRYATVRPHFTARALGLASGLFGVLLVSYHCPSDEGMHQLAWHLIPSLAMAWIFSRIAVRVLRF